MKGDDRLLQMDLREKKKEETGAVQFTPAGLRAPINNKGRHFSRPFHVVGKEDTGGNSMSQGQSVVHGKG